MKKIFLMLILALGLMNAETLEVSADKFSSNDALGITTIEGNVHIKKSKDTLEASKVIIHTDKNRKPQFYEAEGDVKFHIFMENGREIKGHSDKLTYNAQNGEYRLLQNAVVNEVGKENTIRGEEIIINNESGYANVTGSKSKPAKFIFNLDDMQKNKSQDSKEQDSDKKENPTQDTPKEEAK